MKTKVSKPSRKLYFVSLGLLLLGMVLFFIVLIQGIYSTINVLDTRIIVPGTSIIELRETGKYSVFWEYESVIDGKVFQTDSINGLKCTLMKVNTGELITLENPSVNSSYSVEGREGKNIYEFNISEAGKYELKAWYENGKSEETVLAIGKGFGMTIVRTVLISTIILFVTLGTSISIFIITFRRRKAESVEEFME
ncbi:hypothetical protein [Acetivibrio clariflavus]|uniref:Uncharacterized protein n=1 Tax=Acetivibrio clariflavus (strain DSM 19732 / NBRC 101661 / EBR45) TaxID=720554 RepID=G8LTD0_ACECE|nr:hypothetical protein [Acetivibrio clariflavus]AEV68377.1 hypothetical protein Clocl_1768 [Acetivibrio clariflavus DSM 19732]